jgi:predicted Zn-dependent peptidase
MRPSPGWSARLTPLFLVLACATAKGDSLFSSVIRYRLANQLEVLLAPEPGSPRVVVDLLFRGGAANEKPGQYGYAHLFEHMLLRGSEHIPKAEQNAVLASIGADREAMTQFDYTEMYVIAPANQLETLLWLRSDQVGFSARQVTNEALNTERNVVFNEIHQREALPFARAHRRAFEILFPKPHPYHGFIGGSVEDLANAKPEDVRHFFETYFCPNHLTLVISGGFDPETAKKLIDKYFGTLPPGPDAATSTLPPPALKGELRDTVIEPAGAPRLTFAWLIPPPHVPERAAVDLFPFLLGEGPASLLQHRLVRDLAIADSVSCWTMDAVAASVLFCDVSLRSGASVQAVVDEVNKSFDELRDNVSAAAVDRAKITWRASLLRDIEDLVTRTETLASYYLYTGRTEYFAEDLKRHDAVTVASLQDAARRWLTRERRVVITVAPEQHP